MSRWNWLKDRPNRLETGSLDDVLKDIDYCRQRAEITPLKTHVKAWKNRQREAEEVLVERFGENALLNRKSND